MGHSGAFASERKSPSWCTTGRIRVQRVTDLDHAMGRAPVALAPEEIPPHWRVLKHKDIPAPPGYQGRAGYLPRGFEEIPNIRSQRVGEEFHGMHSMVDGDELHPVTGRGMDDGGHRML